MWRVHRLDQISAKKPAKLLDSRSLTLSFSRQQIWPVFLPNADKMRYPDFRAQGLFIGSGVIEAGCKTVIGSRLKQSGMFWTVQDANRIIALRCCRASGKFEDFWEKAQSAA